MTVTTRMTVKEFDEFVQQQNKLFEFIGGEVVEVVSNNYSSQIAGLILFYIQLHCHENNINGHITGADGGYIISGERYIPDVAFISAERQPEPSHAAYNENVPDLAVEVLSPGNTDRDIRLKMVNYRDAGVTLWIVSPDKYEVEVYEQGKKGCVMTLDDTIEGGDVLPELRISVKSIFPDKKDISND